MFDSSQYGFFDIANIDFFYVAKVYSQCCNEAFDGKFPIGRPGASSAEFRNIKTVGFHSCQISRAGKWGLREGYGKSNRPQR